MTTRYRHFCPMARTLELVGDRWTLLVVRDLLLGPRRFNPLLDLCTGITPRQLTIALRRLEEAGVVARERAGREVWYRLTSRGETLAPVVDELLAWGVRHAAVPPEADEPVHAEHVLNGTRVALQRAPQAPPHPVTWTWRFPDGPCALHWDGARWDVAEAGADADVVIDTTARAWAEFVTTPRTRRTLDDVRVTGERAAVDAFARSFVDA